MLARRKGEQCPLMGRALEHDFVMRQAEGNRLMSIPISETMTLALRLLMPGIDAINSTAMRKRARPTSTYASHEGAAIMRAG